MKHIDTRTRRTVLKGIGAGIVGGAVLTGSASAAADGDLEQELADVRAATAKYRDLENALADGYLPEDHAVCGMGYHYPHEDLVAGIQALVRDEDPTVLAEFLSSLDRTEPPVLAYGETDDGLVLGAVEYLTMDESTDFFPSTEKDEWHPFVGPLSALHAWVHTPNPEGVFHPTNPSHQFTHPEWCEEGDGDH